MNIPKTMQAMVLEGHGGLEQLVYHDNWPTPQPNDDEVLIKVGACGLNNTDVNTRTGWYSKKVTEATTGSAYEEVNDEDPTWGGAPISFPRIQGADAAGTVVAVGINANPDLIGKRVITDGWLRDWDDPFNKDSSGYFGSECDGGFAQYTKTHFRNAGVVDCDLTDAELATFSCSYSTAEGMLARANVTSKDTVLVTGASGGVGSALIQLAKRRGACVVGLASENKHSQMQHLGADALLPRDPDNLSVALQQATGRDTVSVVADIVGGDTFGSLIHIFSDLIGYIERKEVKPMLAASYPLTDLRDAQQAFIDKKHVGNIAVTMT